MMKERHIVNELDSIDGSFESYKRLIEFFHANKSIASSDIFVSLHQWFAANMSAVLGALFDKLQENFNAVKFIKIDKKIEKILRKNNFLSFYYYRSVNDSYHTTIPYLKLKPEDGKFFNNYVFNELLNRKELPEMSHEARNKIAEAIYEIFVNAQIHSETQFIYTCGQFYPMKNKIEFTIVDLGIGIKNRVNRRFNTNLNAVQAIKWAMRERSTTKIGISGGIGLAFLKEFIEMNRGKMQIISNEGFYQFGEQGEEIELFDNEFPGTIVNLQFRTNDNNSYILNEKVDIDDIF